MSVIPSWFEVGLLEVVLSSIPPFFSSYLLTLFPS